jgi:hypothetical protein
MPAEAFQPVFWPPFSTPRFVITAPAGSPKLVLPTALAIPLLAAAAVPTPLSAVRNNPPTPANIVPRMLIVDGVEKPAMLVVPLAEPAAAAAVPPSAALVDVPHPVAGVMLDFAFTVLVTG